MDLVVCPLSMASESVKHCTSNCQFYDSNTGECMLAKAVWNLAIKS